ncbi:hypothetical protein TCAL_16728 [Tigriopus californicus]|uniref:G-protein coupled receptors family 1 profile domain-containing protein n=1 Tax=Tigriopus californicus TaxID=6832 RepID=A0A553PMM4_TIGCA|nr:hypothetical protein TCAL_16728 [Tigriopus californicus]
MAFILSLFFAYLCISAIAFGHLQFVINPDYNKDYNLACKVMGFLVLFFFLHTFAWMNVLSYDIFQKFSTLPRSSIAKRAHERAILYKYTCYATGVPAFVTSITAIVEFFPQSYHGLRPGFGLRNCFFEKPLASFHSDLRHTLRSQIRNLSIPPGSSPSEQLAVTKRIRPDTLNLNGLTEGMPPNTIVVADIDENQNKIVPVARTISPKRDSPMTLAQLNNKKSLALPKKNMNLTQSESVPNLNTKSPTTPESPMRKTPIPANSPLLTPHKPATNSNLERVKTYNRNLRRARSFRAQRERSYDNTGLREGRCNSTSTGTAPPMPMPKEVSFTIRKSQFGRRGWKVMPEDNLNLRHVNGDIIEKVMCTIRDFELSGRVVPERMTLRLMQG